MFSQLWLLLILSLLTLEGPQPSTGSGYTTKSSVDLLENDSRYISYQGEFSRWADYQKLLETVSIARQSIKLATWSGGTVNWVDVCQSSKWFRESAAIDCTNVRFDRTGAISNTTNTPICPSVCICTECQQWSRFNRVPQQTAFMTPQYIRLSAAFNQKKFRVLHFVKIFVLFLWFLHWNVSRSPS